MTETVEPGYIRSAAYELTRPADTTAYASGDAIANSDSAASVAGTIVSNAETVADWTTYALPATATSAVTEAQIFPALWVRAA